MSKNTLEVWSFTDGFDSSSMATVANRRKLAAGSKNQIVTGNGKLQAFKGVTEELGKQGSLFLTNAGEGYAGIGSYGNSAVLGSVFRVLSALFFVGNGALRFNGAPLGANASSILQLKLLESGSYAGTTYQAGLSQPSAPQIAALSALGAGFEGKNKAGTYSIKINKVRSATGARSLASLQSNVVTVTEQNGTGQSIRITFPAIGGNGADRWGVYGSPRNFGSTGNHYLIREVAESDLTTIDGVPRSIEIEWTDGDLVGQPLAPIDSFPPPAAVFGGVLGDSVFLDGCYGDVVSGVSSGAPGSTGVISLPLRPEEFPPDWTFYPPEPPTALLRGGDGFYYRFGKSSMGVISNVGGEPPIAFSLMWANAGVSYPHNATIGMGGRLYAKCGKLGFLRIGEGGEPESRWAAPISDIVADWDDEHTVLGYDNDSHTLVATNGKKLVTYNEQLDSWGAPVDLTDKIPGDVAAAVTVANSLIFSVKDDAASTLKIYQYNIGTGMLMQSVSDWHFSEGESDSIRQISVWMRADSLNPVLLEIFADEDDGTVKLSRSITPSKTGIVQLQDVRVALPNLRSFSVKLSQQTNAGDAGFEKVVVSGTSRMINS